MTHEERQAAIHAYASEHAQAAIAGEWPSGMSPCPTQRNVYVRATEEAQHATLWCDTHRVSYETISDAMLACRTMQMIPLT